MPRKPKSHAQRMREAAGRPHDPRPNFRQRGYTSAWDKLRKAWIRHHPLCVECERQGFTEAATVVDHIIPKVEGGSDSPENLQSLCRFCHARKTAAEVRRRKSQG